MKELHNVPRFEFVASGENNHYLLWQAMLFHYSCVRQQRQSPLVMVHLDPGQPLLEGFQRIVERGGRVQTAPNYRRLNGVNFPPRNTPASLKHIDTDADYIVLCDCDMVFLQPLPLERLALGPQQVSFDEVGYLQPDLATYQPSVDDTCRRAGVSPERLRQFPMNGGVPHVIPRSLQLDLAADWLHCLDLFPLLDPQLASSSEGVEATESPFVPQKNWLAGMWGIVFSMHRLGLDAVMTRLSIPNLAGPAPLPGVRPGGPCLIHYCYDDERFSKRQYLTGDAAERDVWRVEPRGDGSVHDEVRRQLLEARAYYGLAPTDA